MEGKDPDLAVNEVSENGDPRTLSLHLERFLSRVQGWLIRVSEWVAKQGMILSTPDIKGLSPADGEIGFTWQKFLKASSILAINHERLYRGEVILKVEQPVFTHARLVYAGMGLGP